MKTKKILAIIGIIAILTMLLTTVAFANTPDVSGAIENTWKATQTQIKAVVNNMFILRHHTVHQRIHGSQSLNFLKICCFNA